MLKISQNDFKGFGQLTKELTAEAKSNPKAFIKKIAQSLTKNSEIALYFNDEQTEYFVMPYINDNLQTTEELNQQIIAGQANCVGSTTSFATASTIGCAIGGCAVTLSCLSCASTASTHAVVEVIQDNPVKNPALTTALTDNIKNDIVKK